MAHMDEQELERIRELFNKIWLRELELQIEYERVLVPGVGLVWVPKSVDEIRIDSRKIVQEIVDRKPHNNDEQEHER